MKNLSKTIAHALRHSPSTYGVTLNSSGWVPVAELAAAFTAQGSPTTVAQILEVVASDSKTRFAVQGGLIRANQGHSVQVNLQLPAVTPPEVLFHGTVGAALSSIRSEGLQPMKRHAVHLSESVETATTVAARRGTPVILQIAAGKMASAGHTFMRSENGVWLTAEVPAEFIVFP